MSFEKNPLFHIRPRCGVLFAALFVFMCVGACGEGAPAARPALRARPAMHAGSWYPADPQELRREIDARLAAAQPVAAGPAVIALVAPHAGLRFSGGVAAAAYRTIQEQAVERFILLGPPHRVGFVGIALPAREVGAYATPLGELAIDRKMVEALRGEPGFGGPPEAHDPEHSLEMHAIFFAAVHPKALLVPLVVGQVGEEPAAQAAATRLRRHLRPGDVVVASSDFTHFGPGFGYVPFSRDVPQGLEKLLDGALGPLLAGDLAGFGAHLASTGDTICGREPVRLLLKLLPRGFLAVKAAADTSGRMTGDYRSSVSYLSVVYRRPGGWSAAGAEAGTSRRIEGDMLDDADRRRALHLARAALEAYLGEGRIPSEDELGVPSSGPLRQVLGAFVTLERGDALRGCIGSILPVRPLWEDIRDNAVAAAVRDSRFPPVVAEELGELTIEISVLTSPSPVAGPEEIEIGRHGIVIQALGRGAVFLPQVAPEQGWDRATTLSHLALKAGLDANAWRTPTARFQVFEAQVFAEQDRNPALERAPSPTIPQ